MRLSQNLKFQKLYRLDSEYPNKEQGKQFLPETDKLPAVITQPDALLAKKGNKWLPVTRSC